ncbi:malonate--CoA ligase [Ferruginivarius sediminum]|uniref:3-methylmercaptopropionyl-CoA ligase n=1 Tax=Ferruginivarius sediminum TaxID=2661937 RepID=A0A369T849_9PROT|nr:malonyl-CoA synthase [Ferruginivarius sediminum]RDD60634.1 malonyl-CoA synthase [Ferruginivarius sediminum]
MSDNLYEIFEARFAKAGDQAAIELADGTTWSYRDLEAEVGRIARLLLDLGVAPGDRVAVQVEKSPRALFAYLACFKAGAIYLPLNTAYKGGEIEYFLGDAEPRVFVCDPSRLDELKPIADKTGVAHVLTLDATGGGSLAEHSTNLDSGTPTVPREADDIAAICYTSGTTGRSKGAMLSHRNLSSNARTLHEIWGFQPGDVLLHALPLFHVHGLFVASNTALLNASKMIFLPKFDADEVIRLLPKATVMMGVPTFYVRLLEREAFTREVVGNMRLFVAGSAPLHPDTFAEFERRTGHRILERYGMTEAGMITSNPLDGERRPGTVGFPLPGVEARVCDEDGKVLENGEVGVLEIKGPNLFKGYWRKPDKTAEEFRDDGFFITGDNALIDNRGYVHIVGRAKDLIISGGYNVYPKEVEIVIDDLPGVKESAVYGVPHPDFGEAVTATVVPEGADAPDEQTVIQAVKKQLANYKVPKRVFFAESLPRNTMGKVQKNQLRDEHKTIFTSAA